MEPDTAISLCVCSAELPLTWQSAPLFYSYLGATTTEEDLPSSDCAVKNGHMVI